MKRSCQLSRSSISLSGFLFCGALLLAGCGTRELETMSPAVDPTGGQPGTLVPLLGKDPEDTIDQRYIVVYPQDSSVDPAKVNEDIALLKSLGGTVDLDYRPEILAIAATLPETALNALRHRTSIEYIESDANVSIASPTPVTPTPHVGWGLDRIDQRERLPGPADLPTYPRENFAAYAMPGTGKGVAAYVLDTGIRTSHGEFGGFASAPGPVVPRTAFPLYTAVLDGQGTNDCHGHGTHVAGILAGKSFGVAKDASVFAVRVLGCNGNGSLREVIDGMRQVIRHHRQYPGPAVGNMSLVASRSRILDSVIEMSVKEGIAYVVAAGNGRSDACKYSPAAAPSAVTVGAISDDDRMVDTIGWGSNFGPCVDIFAPGADILSAGHRSDDAYRSNSGTSMAAPFVAGAVALYFEQHPSESPQQAVTEILRQATRGKISQTRTTPDPKLLYVPSGPLPAAIQIANRWAECTGGLGQWKDTWFVVPPLPPGARAVISATPDGKYPISVDDQLRFECYDTTSTGPSGPPRTLDLSFSSSCAMGILPQQPRDVTSLLSTTRPSGCHVVLYDNSCGGCIGEWPIYLSIQ